MPSDFKSFAKENKSQNKDNDKINEYTNLINKYKSMDKSTLIQTLFSEAEKLKQQGKLNKDSLNSIKSTLTPFLNGEQQQMLEELISELDKD